MNAVLSALPLLTHEGGRDWGHSWWPLWLFVWAALIVTAIWLVSRRRGRRSYPFDRPSELLAERYARGELSAEEYRERLDELKRTFHRAKSDG